MIRNRILTVLATAIVVFIIGCAEDSPSSAQTGHTGQYKITHYSLEVNGSTKFEADTVIYLDVLNGKYTKYTQTGSVVSKSFINGILDLKISNNDMILTNNADSEGLTSEIYSGIKSTFAVPPTVVE